MTIVPNSSTGGYLRPYNDPIKEDNDLDDLLQEVVVGITGLVGNLVRPRWQLNPPQEPGIDVNWVAIGISGEPDPSSGTTYVRHFADRPDGDGHSEEQRHTIVEILASFYGPNGRGYMNMLRDGLYIAQNREALLLAGMALIDMGDPVNAPELINTQWRRRVDLLLRFRRIIVREFAIENLLEASGELVTGQGSVNGSVRGEEPFDTDNVRNTP